MKFRRIVCALCLSLMCGGTFAAPAALAEEEPAEQVEMQQPAPPQIEQIPIEESGVFTAAQVESQVKMAIDLFEKGDIAALQASANDRMRAGLTEKNITGAKDLIAPKWGARVAFGKPYMFAQREGDEIFAVCEIAVGYKTTAVNYRIAYDRNMKIAGFFVR